MLAILLAFKLLRDHVTREKENKRRVGEGDGGDRSKIVPVNGESEESGGDEGVGSNLEMNQEQKSEKLKTWS